MHAKVPFYHSKVLFSKLVLGFKVQDLLAKISPFSYLQPARDILPLILDALIYISNSACISKGNTVHYGLSAVV